MDTNNYFKKVLPKLIFGLAISLLTTWGNLAQAQVSVTATAGTAGPTVYSTVNDVFTAINAGTHQGVIVISVTANTTEPAPAVQLLSSGTGSSLYQSVTIVPQGNVTINSAAAPTSGRGILEFIGADSVTIDGDDPLTPGTRNLTLLMATNSSSGTACIRFSSASSTGDGCMNATVKNCIITGGRNSATTTTTSYGIFSGLSSAGSTITTASGSASSTNMHIENNSISRAYYGIYCYGITAYPMDNLVIKNNTLGSATSASNIGFRGILTSNTATSAGATSAIIRGNDIRLGDYGTAGYSVNISGIEVPANNAGILISGNNIHDVNQPSTGGYGAYGIFVSSGTSNAGIQIVNNMIRDMKVYWYQASYTSTFMPMGVFISSGATGILMNNNTIVMNPQLAASSSYTSFGLLVSSSSTTFSQFNNNLIINNQVSSGAHAVSFNASGNISAAAMDKNNYFVAGSNIGYYSGSTRTTLAAWKTATSKDSNSFNVNPVFVSATDLHLVSGLKTPLESGGTSVAGVTTDIDGDVRPGPAGSIYGGALAADIGADEADLMPDLYGIDSIPVDQIVAFVAPGNTNKQVLKMRVYVSGSIGTPLSLNSLILNTAGTTSASDLTNATVYYTGNSSSFSTAIPYGTPVSSPNGSFTVSGTQALSAGVNYFWLAYDISGTATDGNLADGRLDSMDISGTYKLPANGDPAGYITINLPMTFVSSTTTQSVLSKVETGSSNNQIIGIQVVTSATGSPADISSFDIAPTGTDSLPDITNLKVWYTGSSSTFATTTQFGSTVAVPSATQTVTGTQSLVNGTNYFWVTYDIIGGASLGHAVDGEVTSLVFAGGSQIPTVTAPAGTRLIRQPYCATAYASGCGTDYIARVRLKTLDNVSVCNGGYTFFNSVTVPNITRGITDTITMNYGSDGNQYARAWIDYNDDGDFTDAGEDLGIQTPANAGSSGQAIIVFTVPCNAALGNLRLRLRGGDDNQPGSGQSCGASSSSYGEGEDYLVNVLDNPILYVSHTAIQNAGVIAPNTSDAQILRIPVKATGCGVGTLTEMHFNTGGTTLVSDIVTAKLYATGNTSTFNTVKLLGTVSAPSGQFNFTGLTDTLLSGASDTNNYWLAYDITPSFGSINNVVDAQLDSIYAVGGYRIPTDGNPSGGRMIDLPMTYTSSTVAQASTARVEKGSANNKILKLQIVTSAIGSPINLSSLDISTNGTDSLPDLTNLKVWYTGSSSTFVTTTQFGATVASPGATQTVTGAQPLLNGNNYFWVSYDIASGAPDGHNVDGEITAAVIGAVTQTPSVTAPAGTRQIRSPYCVTSPYYTNYEDIGQIVLNQNGGPILSNGVGCTPLYSNPAAGHQYTDYSALTPADVQNSSTVDFSICTINDNTFMVGCYLAIFIDYNQNGAWDAGEQVYTSTATTTTVTTFTGSFVIPCTASLGETRMRVVMQSYNIPTLASACYNGSSNYYYGETEDYTINIVNNPIGISSANTLQITGSAAPGDMDKKILRVPVKVSGCGVGIASDFKFSTTGTTNAADIAAAKLYATGSSAIFNTSRLLGTVTSPSGQFSFSSLTDTLLNGATDTNNYWLAYDLAVGATSTNVVDAALDSVELLGSYYIPTVSNPAGNILVEPAMTYVSSTATQPVSTKVGTGSTNNVIIGYQVVTSATGSPINLTSLDVATTGTDSLPDIVNLKVWYTGNSNVFSGATQFGSTVATPAAIQTITGTSELTNGTNYFWVTYDVAGSATVGHFIDGEITSATVAGVIQTPSVTAPSGHRQIKAPYCIPAHLGGSLITNITMNTMNYNPPTGSTPWYRSVSSAVATTTVTKNIPVSLTITNDAASIVSVWIDYNDDGTFDASEWHQVVFSSTGGAPSTVTFTIPCTAVNGEVSMRIRSRNAGNTNGAIDACTAFGSGECQDYVITILDNPPVYNSATTLQQTGLVAPGTTDRQVLRVPVKVSGCGVPVASEFYFNTAGSTTSSDIVNAKLYATGNSAVFNTSKLVGTVAAPSGAFAFMVTDTLVANDTTNYWLAYDISASAALSNIIDATFDSLYVMGAYQLPTVNAPAGSIMVDAPMTYISSTATQSDSAKVETGSINNNILGMEVVMSGIGSAVNMTQFDLNVTGTTDTSNIRNIRIWYTGNSNSFATTSQFGATLPTLPGSMTYSVTGTLPLLNGSNYFWLTYDIDAASVLGNFVDAELVSATIAGVSQVPTVSAPVGHHEIRAPYCASGATNTADEEIFSVTFNGITNSLACGVTAPGPGSIAYRYSNFSGTTMTTVVAGGNVPFTVEEDECDGATYYSPGCGIWIDFNQNGVFTDPGEEVFMESVTALGPRTITGMIAIPSTASYGLTRMRVTVAENTAGTGVLTPCLSYGYGETEDYTINIIPLPAPTVYTWNVAGTGSFNNSTNWTPTRTTPIYNDILVVNGGGATTMTGVPNQTVKSFSVANSTTVTLAGSGELISTDTLSIGAGSKISTGSGLTLTLGSSGSAVGVLDGTGSVEGALTRWISASAAGSYAFPMTTAGNNRYASLNYTVAPSTAGKLAVRYVTGAPGTSGLPIVDAGLTLTNVDVTGVWRATPDGSLSGGTFDVTINADNVPAVFDYTQTALLGRLNSGSSWLAVGTAVSTTGSNAAMIMGRTGVNAYGEFGIASTSVNPLPVKLTSFTAAAKSNDVLASWTTASEINNKGFEVQRSADGLTFEYVSFVKGAGNSSRTLNYSLTDAKAFDLAKTNVLYYRLKQIDFNGKSSYSQIVRVTRNAEKAISLSAHPNPFNNAYDVSFNALSEGSVTIRMIDIQGRVVNQHSAKVTTGLNEVTIDNLDQLHAGVYFINVTVDGETQVLKLVKN